MLDAIVELSTLTSPTPAPKKTNAHTPGRGGPRDAQVTIICNNVSGDLDVLDKEVVDHLFRPSNHQMEEKPPHD